ncbi:hypothetical protein GCM10009865_24650 [Aeromicrobium ponti]
MFPMPFQLKKTINWFAYLRNYYITINGIRKVLFPVTFGRLFQLLFPFSHHTNQKLYP